MDLNKLVVDLLNVIQQHMQPQPQPNYQPQNYGLGGGNINSGEGDVYWGMEGNKKSNTNYIVGRRNVAIPCQPVYTEYGRNNNYQNSFMNQHGWFTITKEEFDAWKGDNRR